RDEVDLSPLRIAERLQLPEHSSASTRARSSRMTSCGSGGSRPSRKEDQGEDSGAFHMSNLLAAGIVRFCVREVYSGRCAGVAELANALGLGPSGAEVPYRFKSCRPHSAAASIGAALAASRPNAGCA